MTELWAWKVFVWISFRNIFDYLEQDTWFICIVQMATFQKNGKLWVPRTEIFHVTFFTRSKIYVKALHSRYFRLVSVFSSIENRNQSKKFCTHSTQASNINYASEQFRAMSLFCILENRFRDSINQISSILSEKMGLCLPRASNLFYPKGNFSTA